MPTKEFLELPTILEWTRVKIETVIPKLNMPTKEFLELPRNCGIAWKKNLKTPINNGSSKIDMDSKKKIMFGMAQ